MATRKRWPDGAGWAEEWRRDFTPGEVRRLRIARRLRVRHQTRSVRRISPRDWPRRWPGWMPF